MNIKFIFTEGWNHTWESVWLTIVFSNSISQTQVEMVERLVKCWFNLASFGGFGGSLRSSSAGMPLGFPDELEVNRRNWAFSVKRISQAEMIGALAVLREALSGLCHENTIPLEAVWIAGPGTTQEPDWA